MTETDNSTCAQIYVLGRMRGPEQRADPAPRSTVLKVSLQARVPEQLPQPRPAGQRRWRDVSDRVASMPQMRFPGVPGIRLARQKSDAATRPGLDRLAVTRGLLLAGGLLAAFGLGYATGLSAPATAQSATTSLQAGATG